MSQKLHSPSKVALYGGSFDPFHLGHFEVIHSLFELDISQLILMPTFCNPLKTPSYFPPHSRLEMCQRVAMQCQHIGLDVVASDFEVRSERAVFSIESVKYTYKQLSPLDSVLFVLGQDSFEELWQWRDVEELCGLVEFVLIARELPSKISTPHRAINGARVYKTLHLERNSPFFASSNIRKLLDSGKYMQARELIPIFLWDLIEGYGSL